MGIIVAPLIPTRSPRPLLTLRPRRPTSPFQGEVEQAAHELPHLLRRDRYASGAQPLVNVRALSPPPGMLNRRCRFVLPVRTRAPSRMNVLKGILLKLVSALMFAVMQALVRSVGENIPVGEVVFFRSLFAVIRWW